MSETGNKHGIDFSVDKDNLYREEAITDLKVASIRRLIPIKPDGSDDTSREIFFVGHTQLMSPDGPVPIQSKLEAKNLADALDEFPGAMDKAMDEVVARFQQMRQQQAQQQAQQQNDSRIITP